MKLLEISAIPYPNVKIGDYIGVPRGYGSDYFKIKKIDRKQKLLLCLPYKPNRS